MVGCLTITPNPVIRLEVLTWVARVIELQRINLVLIFGAVTRMNIILILEMSDFGQSALEKLEQVKEY